MNPPILTVNNKKEEKFLRRKTSNFDFSKYSKKEIRDLVKTMRAVMKEGIGVGLSANQIGLDIKVFVARLDNKTYAFFNPKITNFSKETSVMEEGCLSVPGVFGPVERPEKITIDGQDQNGKKMKIKAWGYLGRIFQHECDHLNGIIFTDKAIELYKERKEPRKK
ncbi:MAG: peptide deformylase [Candidatus Pacebacteria bacterium]|nr:peptide deformylase [Candidatus Paceibacterota bacterium]